MVISAYNFVTSHDMIYCNVGLSANMGVIYFNIDNIILLI